MKTIWGMLCLFLVAGSLPAQNPFADAEGPWTAQWITHPDIEGTEAGVYLFRKTIELAAVPDEWIVYVSADNGYKLYVNEQMVSVGPARGDLNHWNYETVDLGPYLQAGTNTLAAKVWNEGSLRAVAQMSWQTGFFCRGPMNRLKSSIRMNPGRSCRIKATPPYVSEYADTGLPVPGN